MGFLVGPREGIGLRISIADISPAFMYRVELYNGRFVLNDVTSSFWEFNYAY